MEVVVVSGEYSPYRLLVMMNTTGVFQTAAMLSDSWNVPMLVAPSPKNVSATCGSPWILKRQRRTDRDGRTRAHDGVGTDVAVGGVDEVHRAADALGASRSSGPSAPRTRSRASCPAPAPRRGRGRCWSGRRPSASPRSNPTETASWPWHRCVVPSMRPPMNSSWTFSSKRRMVHHLVEPADPPVSAGRGVGHRASTPPRAMVEPCAGADDTALSQVAIRCRFRVGTVSSFWCPWSHRRSRCVNRVIGTDHSDRRRRPRSPVLDRSVPTVELRARSSGAPLPSAGPRPPRHPGRERP